MKKGEGDRAILTIALMQTTQSGLKSPDAPHPFFSHGRFHC
jgi:hypothetical protein